MAKETPRQRKTVDRVMHEFKHGELKSGPQGHGGKVKSRKQAVAIALSEAGASNQESPAENKHNLARTKAKEARGETAMQEKEGKRAKTRTELEAMARHRDIKGRSTMTKSELEKALRHH
ncbi:MAG TPA: DUF6496 domain-containing protein [Caulobacteraceae bacterium]|jgi:hypothetical protein